MTFSNTATSQLEAYVDNIMLSPSQAFIEYLFALVITIVVN